SLKERTLKLGIKADSNSFPENPEGRVNTMECSSPEECREIKEHPLPSRICSALSRFPEKEISNFPDLNSRRISRTEPCKITLERLIREICSQSSSTEAILCVEKITVAPSSLRCMISFFISSALMGSKPLKGSSKIKRSGLCKIV